MDEIKVLDEIMELLKTKQYTVLRQRLSEINHADIADILEQMEEDDRLKVFRILPKDLAADVFAYLEVDNQMNIPNALMLRNSIEVCFRDLLCKNR